jgi:hypothetical protein
MGTTITLAADAVTITITGGDVYVGCTYDKLEGWYGVENVDLGMVKRPGAPGSFAPSQTFPGEKAISIEGDFFGASRAAGLQMREDLSMLYNEGRPVRMTVADDLRTTSRDVLIASVSFPWTIHQEFEFSIDMTADDPRRYGAEVANETALAAPGTGFVWPAVWPIDWGTIGVSGRVTILNGGNTETMSRFVVDNGEMPDGFEIVNVTTGQRLVYLGPVVSGTAITLDTETRTATIGASAPGSPFLASPQWWAVPPRSSVELQFLARGAVTGSPRLRVYTAPAFY